MNSIYKKGFTLIELLVVMAVLGILVTIISANFRSSQMRGRDAQRKSDIKQLSNSLEIFFSDHGVYPQSNSGNIVACPYRVAGTSTDCTWGQSEFTDGNTTYLKELPTDPLSQNYYYYVLVSESNNQKYQLFARLENPEDQDCINKNCVNPVSYSCGSSNCNFAITSSNVSPTE